MKKTLSINVSGIIFHIEEDGYETLRKYLDSINRYFSAFDDSSEIIADIENRIAEIFLSKLNDGKQVITAEDVAQLMTVMGNVNDFKAAEDPESHRDATGTEKERTQTAEGKPSEPKKLVRDKSRKILGGVCAGLAHYFSIDPVWTRLIFALLSLGYGGGILIYIILWIVLPTETLEEESSVKKMYRNPGSKVLGGVAGGIAAFFGADVILVRILFVLLSFFGGFGVILYIILWISIPEAKTITEKMEMQGEPVTLSNIESSVKKSLNEKDTEESTFAKIVLFPFRALAAVINFIGKILGPIFRVLVDIIRVMIGIFIILIGITMILSILFAFGIVFGLFSSGSFPAQWHLEGLSLPMDAIKSTFPVWSFVAAFFVALIPALFIQLLGSSIIAKRIVFRPIVGWIMFIIFFVSVLVLGVTLPRMILSFKEDGDYKIERTFDSSGKTVVLKINETGLDDYRVTDLSIKGYEGKQIKLVEKFIAQGSTHKNAIDNAHMVSYNVQHSDSVLTFDSNITFNKDALFRAQRLEMDLFIPYNTQFVISEEMWRIIDNNYHDYEGYRDSNFDKTWKMTERGFECVNCTEPTEQKALELNDQYGLKDFNELEINGIFNLVITRNDVYSVEIKGSESEKRKFKVDQSGDRLEIDYRTRNKTFWMNNADDETAKIYISMPNLTKLKIKGAGKIKIEGFNEDDMDISLLGAMTCDAKLDVRNLQLDLSGPMVFELDGNGEVLEADVTKVAQLKASGFEVRHAIVNAREMGRARVNATEKVEIETDFTGSVKYQGNPEVIKRD
jgi:phage shock protein PspC (stress-responsive transcriptional regulator)